MHGLQRAFCIVLLLIGTVPAAVAENPTPNVKANESKATESKAVEVKRGHVPSYPRVITGKIADAAGKPVSGAVIEWGPDYPHDAPRETARSGADGSYRLEAMHAGGHYKLGISAAGFSPHWQKGLIPGTRSAPSTLDFTLSPETTIQIEIVSLARSPIPHLDVLPMTPQFGFHSSFSTVQQPEPIPGHDRPAKCDEHGVCQLQQLPQAPRQLLAPAEGTPPFTPEQAARFNEQGWLSLRITQNGKWVHEHQISFKEYFDSQGKFQVVIPDYRNPLVQMNRQGTIYGQVVDAAGQPVTSYHVTFRHRPEPIAISDSDGRFQRGPKLDPEDRYEVRIFANGFAPQVRNIIPRDTTQDKPERIELAPHKSAQFQLIDGRTQQPLPNLQVVTGVAKKSGWNYVDWHNIQDYADGNHGLENVYRVTSDADGRLVVPEGDAPVALIILAPGYGRRVISAKLRPAPDDAGVIKIRLHPAASIRAIATPGSRLSRDADGITLATATSDGFEHMFHGLKRDSQGGCLIESLAPGIYQVVLMHSDGNMSAPCWARKIVLKAGEQLTVNLGEMTGAFTLSGQATPFSQIRLTRKPPPGGAANSPTNTVGATSVATFADVDGYFQLDQLESGTYQIEQGGLAGFARTRMSLATKGLGEIVMTADTHLDLITGTITRPQARP